MTPRGVIKAVTTGAQAVIPPRKNHTVPCEYDKHLYRERHLVECFRHQDQALPASVLTLRQVGKELLELCEFCQRAHLATMKCQHNLACRGIEIISPTGIVNLSLQAHRTDYLARDESQLSSLLLFNVELLKLPSERNLPQPTSQTSTSFPLDTA